MKAEKGFLLHRRQQAASLEDPDSRARRPIGALSSSQLEQDHKMEASPLM